MLLYIVTQVQIFSSESPGAQVEKPERLLRCTDTIQLSNHRGGHIKGQGQDGIQKTPCCGVYGATTFAAHFMEWIGRKREWLPSASCTYAFTMLLISGWEWSCSCGNQGSELEIWSCQQGSFGDVTSLQGENSCLQAFIM